VLVFAVFINLRAISFVVSLLTLFLLWLFSGFSCLLSLLVDHGAAVNTHHATTGDTALILASERVN
jgi:hypothetical protein